MADDFDIEGARRLELLAWHLKQTGNAELRKELFRGLNRATRPLKQAAQEAARRDLPRRGGLGELVSEAKFSTSNRTGGRNPGVSIRARQAGHDLRAMDRGRLRHPVFGNRRVWVNQQVKPGWFTRSMEQEAPAVRRELVAAIEEVARKVARG